MSFKVSQSSDDPSDICAPCSKFVRVFAGVLLVLAVFRCSNLRAQLIPVNVGHINSGGNAYGIAVGSNRVYLANFNDGLRVYDATSPSNLVALGHTNNGGLASGVAVSGNYVYLANFDDGLRVYNVSTATNPISVGHTNNGGAALGVAVVSNRVFLANNDDGLRIYDVSNPALPTNTGHSTNNNGNGTGVATSGNFALLANNSDGVRIYNVSGSNSCADTAVINDAGIAFGVTVSGNLAYVANGFDGLRVYNVSNPSSPTHVGHTNINAGSAYSSAVSGNYLYLADFDGGLQIFDISNPAKPTRIASINNGGIARGVAIAGSYVYLANGDDGVRVYLIIPQLAIQPTGSNSVQLSWPGPFSEFVLQRNTNITGTNWTTVSNNPALVNGRNQLTLPATGTRAFFRLAVSPAPRLTISTSTTNSAVISWPASYAGFALQNKTNATSTNWVAMTNVPANVEGQYQVTVSPLTGTRFFRLVK